MPRKRDEDEDEDINAALLSLVTTKEKKSSSSSSKSKRKKDDSDDEDSGSDTQQKGTENKKPLKKRKNVKETEKAAASDSDEEFNDGYDDDLMGDEADRLYLMSLPEIQREEVLAERYNKRKILRERYEMKKKMKMKKDGKRESSSSSNQTSPRRNTSRLRTTDTSKASAFSDLKKKRAKARDEYQSDSDENVSDKDSDDDYRAPASKREAKPSRDKEKRSERVRSTQEESKPEEPVIELADLNRLRLDRDFIEKKLADPSFDEIVLGFFVRFGIGKHNEKPIYRVTQIVEVKEQPSKVYKVGKKMTNKYLYLQHGASKKLFPLDNVSNSPFTENEFKHWLTEMRKAGEDIITKADAEDKVALKDAWQHKIFTDQEVNVMVQKNRALNNKIINIPAQKARLITLREAARDANNVEEYENLTKQFEQLEALLDKKQDDKTTSINKKNKMTNKTAKYETQNLGIDAEHDPFSRRQTRPVFALYTMLKDKEKENGNGKEKAPEKDVPTTNNNAKPAQPAAAQTALAKPAKPKKEIQLGPDPESLLKEAHDFDIDIGIVDFNQHQQQQAAALPKPTATSVVPGGAEPKPVKNTLSVTDYKIRRGLI